MEESAVIALLQSNLPLAICDGGGLELTSYFELYAASWLRVLKKDPEISTDRPAELHRDTIVLMIYFSHTYN